MVKSDNGSESAERLPGRNWLQSPFCQCGVGQAGKHKGGEEATWRISEWRIGEEGVIRKANTGPL